MPDDSVDSLRRLLSLIALLLVAVAPGARAQVLEVQTESGEAPPDLGLGPGGGAYQEAMGLMLAGLIPAAAEAFERAIALEPDEPRYHNNLAALLLQRDAWLPRAERAALRGVEHAPQHAPLWINLGIARQRLDRPAEAAEALERGVALDPESGEAHAWLGRAYWRLARNSEPADPELLRRASAEMMTATAFQPDSPVVHYQLGLLLELQGNDEAALASYRQATALAPGHPQGHAKVAELEARLAQAESAPSVGSKRE